ncbi:2-amino-4-hydroxy-6-hydroxymethyldihydropteridine diphosphokinase [Thiomicrorhabdus sp. ZW0627]|uniref:2-amino-4-hydroxy-6- hydroxymethyldihydropteridine diphosphokinase n=1 Tax=Thiomicrorhabdus sp. ZW0627 TaxID=3039774 RepID=UPI002436E915|nr:2-amino-4-hydroxy-6-hydroxymethyldihydropteridine diphosphokinase [Thiomicrorhabdus sp. ZW0627]MDG6773407.1 2-amino-4-hydroxy-6-hydroxymethyldihydropteridine diphosphokinase [Thiomicrorhabdus sp. ZW0627]
MEKVYIGLGSNLDNPAGQIEKALQALDALPETRLLKASRLYSSKPLGPQDQPDFLNAVCLLETALPPLKLLDALQAIEREQGRVKKRHWGERSIDLDILLYGRMRMDSERLTLPHKEIANRDFVLLPLAEISPGLTIPEQGQVENLVERLETTFVVPMEANTQV